ncbi:MAG: ATP-binding cassette domain-containing protein, partial [Caulobacteraceae bacterium]
MDLPEYAVEATNLVKTYPSVRGAAEMKALKGIDLKIPRGSIFGLLGPNGAGKTTTLEMIEGLTPPTA